MSKLPVAVSTTEFYLAALVEEMQALVAGVNALVAAVSVTSAPGGDGRLAGLDEERLHALLMSIKGVGAVTATEIIGNYKASLGK